MKLKPRLWFEYYPASRRGYWRVSHLPKSRTNQMRNVWIAAHDLAQRWNDQVTAEAWRLFEYRSEYKRQLELRKTT
jgi:hypothetical protein